jgi:hypothetical protein
VFEIFNYSQDDLDDDDVMLLDTGYEVSEVVKVRSFFFFFKLKNGRFSCG